MTKYFYIFAILLSAKLNAQSDLDELITQYESSITEYSSTSDAVKSSLAYASINSLFIDPSSNEYHNDLSTSEFNKTTISYLQEIDEQFKGTLDVEFDEEFQEEIKCQPSKYTLVKIKKNNKSKNVQLPLQTVEYLLVIVNTSEGYKLQDVVFLSSSSEDFNCNDNQSDTKSNQLQEIIAEIISQGDRLYSQGNYITAKNKYKEALKLNVTDKELPELIAACEDFIDANSFKDQIALEMSTKNYRKALLLINDVETTLPQSINQEEILELKAICNEGVARSKFEERKKLANSYYLNNDFKNALIIYEELETSTFSDTSIIKRIQDCKNGNPNFIKNQLKLACNAAVKSRKNYLEAFQTYDKYKSSGLLSGSQYHFMCLMMIEEKNSFLKSLGYSKKQARLFARQYFYRAKDLGYNNSQIENQVFTKNIKNRKN